MNCEQVRIQDLVEKYVAGQLPDPDMSAFEQHYFGCDECLSAVQVGQSVQTAVTPAVDRPKVVQMPLRSAARPRWMYPVAAAAAIVVVSLVAWRGFTGRTVSRTEIGHAAEPNPVTTPTPDPVKAAAEPQLLASNVDLGAVDRLGYRPSVLRGVQEESADRFQRAMQAYMKGDYRQTVSGLSAIPVGVPGSGKPEDHVADAGVQLYLGVSQLMLGQNAEAIRSLHRSVGYGDTPYLENAEFYLAKGLVRQKQYADAADVLRRTVALKGDRQSEAQQLLMQLPPR